MAQSTISWSQEELEQLARIHRQSEIIKGMVQSVGFMNIPVQEGGKTVTKETEVAIFRLEGGVTAYCPAPEFSERTFKTLNGFVGTEQNLIITRLDLKHQLALVSVKEADAKKRQVFWDTLKYLEKKDALDEQVFEGVVFGVNPENERIHVRVEGTDCFMLKYDWDWNRDIDVMATVERGTPIQVKVLKFDEERKMVRISRKDTMEDPFKKLENMKEMEVVVGRVADVDSIHGIFVQIEEGVTLKASKPRYLEEPLVGDIVSCKIRSIDAKNRKGKVVIVDYPRGKKKRKDLGSFLYQ
ncbi:MULTISPECIES: S1 RNA-binding domain-containing protein [Rossellomorea]|uniref:S1 RNA-binding domain-containing protein n=1 Tax=Rossellomorea TaxID=2837508 RepID=UPI00191A17B5|nr:S1 RNA-binding domain-containing protein [Rossellomorea arthrocnemi]